MTTEPTTYPGLPIGVLTLDDRFVITAVDAVFRAELGGGDELIGQPLDALISDRDHRGAVALATRLTQYRGGIIDLSLVLVVGGGERFVRARLVARSTWQYLVYVEPGDQEESLTYELALARQRWAGVMQRSDEGIVLVDHAGTILQHNLRFFELMRFRTAHGVSLTESALDGRALGPLLPRAFDELQERLGRGDEDFVVRVETNGRTLEVEGRSLRLPLRGRIETLLLVRDLSEQRQIAERDAIIQADLDQAADFQRALLSRMRSPRGLEVDVAYRPLQRVGGDVYDVTVLADGTVRLFIADATGHGVTAALSTMLIKSEYDAVKEGGDGPAATLAALNERVTRTYLKLAVLFTAAIVDIAPDRTLVRYACGGHPGPMLVTETGVVELSEGGGFLGAQAGQRYPEWSTAIAGWRSIILVTDGVVEARNAAGTQFGEARLLAAIGEADQRGRRINATVLSRLDAYVDTQAQTDDITLLTVRPTQMEDS